MNPLERLGYANGQRLEAGDLRLEQRYHIEVRRLLNRGLFTPGVVSGLEVAAITGQPRKVLVRTGIGIDPVGREVVLRQETTVDVPNQKPVENPLGYFLVIRYAEQQVPATDPWCGTAEGPPRVARVREEPELVWSEHVPAHANCTSGDEGVDCGIVLALVVLDGACKVSQIQSVVREYSHPTHASQVQAIAFEGEKDIDPDNPKVLHFKIRGGAAQSAALFLWGGPFSSLYYTELGNHTHTYSATTDPTEVDHQHNRSAIDTNAGDGDHRHDSHNHGSHGHTLAVNASLNSPGGLLTTKVVVTPPDPIFRFMRSCYVQDGGVDDAHVPPLDGAGNPTVNGSHTHTVPAQLSDFTTPPNATDHTHTFHGTSDGGGVAASPHGLPYIAHGGDRLEFLNELHVTFDKKDITQIVIDRYSPKSWGSPGHPATLGDGSPTHGINSSGTGVIDLMDVAAEVGIDMGQEDHSLTFSVKGGGGKVLYNLYVS
jgi:hypothetical protein